MAEHTRFARRSLFKGLGLAAAAAGVTTLAAKFTAKSPPSDPASAPDKQSDGDGYRLTEHIKKYYRSTTL
jgi:hypothetical protein